MTADPLRDALLAIAQHQPTHEDVPTADPDCAHCRRALSGLCDTHYRHRRQVMAQNHEADASEAHDLKALAAHALQENP